jgi:hypothetical protein
MADQDYNARPRRIIHKNLSATTVPGSSTLMLSIDCIGIERIFVQLQSATAALTNFTIKARANPDATPATIASAAADFTSPSGLIVGASGDLTVLNGSGWFFMDVRGIERVDLYATSGGTATLAAQVGGA